MKKTLSILLSVAMLISMVSLMAVSVSAADSYDPADYDYAYKLTDYMSGNINAGTGTASTTTDAMIITVQGGLLTKYTSYNSNGYTGYAQWSESNNNRVLTFDLKNIESGTYKLTVFTCDNNNARGSFDVSANDTSLGVMNCLNTSGKAFTKHAFDTTFTADGTSPVSVVITPTAETTNKQAFLYSLALTRTGDYVAPASSPVSTVDGASIRLGQKCGLRFSTTVDMSAVEELNTESEAVSLGTLIGPANLVGEELDIEDYNDGNAMDVVYGVAELWDNNQFVASIVNIKEANLTRDFVARGYVKIGDTYYYSDESTTRNIAAVADAFIADANSDYAILDPTAKALVDHWAAAND